MADNHNFRIKNGLEVGGVEVITANGLMVLPNTSTASTQDGGTNNTRIATTAFVQQEITSLIGGAPGSLNTLNELAAAINDDASYASTLTTALATKLPLAGGTLTGNLSLGVYSTTATASLLLNGSTANKQSVLKCTDGNLHIDAASGNSVYLNWYGGTGGTFFGNGSAGQKARIDGSGNLTLSGTVDGVDISARDAILTSTTTTANAAYGWGNHASAGYTNDQTAAEILTAIKTVDGSGSGLDADLLDGLHANGFVKVDEINTDSSTFPFLSKELTGSGIGNSYDERVILIIPRVTTNTSSNNKCVGKVTASKIGGNVFDSFDISAQSVYNSTEANFISMGQRSGHKWVTCTYNGVVWLAIKPQFTANPYNNLWFHGQHQANSLDTNGDALKVISYLDTQNGGTVLNAEINNSIADWTGSSNSITANGYTIWHAGNDGSGSGLDADTVDGLHASSFVRSNANDTKSGNLVFQTSGAVTDSTTGLLFEIGGTYSDGRYRTRFRKQDVGGGIPLYIDQSAGTANSYTAQARFGTYSGNNYEFEVFGDINATGNVYDGGNAVWHTGNDGSGSGLDADLLDGQQGSSYLRSDADDSFSGNLTTAANNHITFGPNSSWSSSLRIGGNGRSITGTSTASVATTNGNLHIDAADSSRGIYLNFYAGTSGTLFGNGNGTTMATMNSAGQLSKGGVDYWHGSNDGSGSGLDADLLDGLNATDSRAGNTIVKRQANGYMQAVYVNTTDDASSASLGWLYGQRSNSDGYHRRFTAASIKSWGGFWASDNDGSGSGLDADLLDGQQGSYYYAASNPSGYTSNVGDITGVTAGTGLTGGGTSGTPTLNVIGGSGITANANDIAVDSTVLTTSTYGTTLTPVYAPVKKGTATLTNSYQTVCTVNGNSLGSSVRMTIAGTGASTVISTILDIVCNHSLDILVTSQTGTYTILTVKIVSNNNEDFAVQLKTNSTNNLPVNMEVFALNSETVAFTSTNPYTGATLEHECKSGGFASSSSGGSAHEFYSNGTKLIAANDNQSLHDTNALSISGSTITLRKGDNTTETIAIPAQGDITGVTAGNGLTGGATSGAATVNVGAGDGISVTANTVTVNSTVVRTTGAQTITGLKTFTDNGGIKYSGISSTPLWLNRSSGTNVNIRLSSSSGTTYVGQGASSGILEIGTTADLIGPGQRVFADNYHPNADKWTTARSHTVTLTGAVTGTVSQSVDGTAAKTWTIATTATADPTLTLAGDVTGSATFTNLGNATLTATVANNSHTHIQANITDSYRLFNNMGQNHSTTTDFNSISNFGVRYVQGNTNGPGTGSTQFYGVTLGLGNEHAISTYAMQLAIPRYLATDKYVSFRTREGGTWQSWTKIAAGTADTWKTARTLTTTLTGDVTGTASMSVNGGSNQTVTINTVVANNSHTHSYLPLAGGTLTGTLNSTTGNYTSTTAANSFTTAHGYIQLGPMNTSWAHIYTDRPGFYLNKEMRVNNNLVWNSGNDGSGSGLDADLLDGIQGSSFLRSDATDTASGAVTFSAATIYMAGDLAHSGDTNTYMGFHAADQWRVVTGGVERLEVNNTAVTVSGNFTATGNITAYSDIRLKEDIKPIEDAVSKVQQLTGNTYTRNDLKDPERRYGGVIAQEVEVVLPEAVNDSEDGTKTVDYNAMIALLIESIKELKAEVDDLKTQLENK